MLLWIHQLRMLKLVLSHRKPYLRLVPTMQRKLFILEFGGKVITSVFRADLKCEKCRNFAQQKCCQQSSVPSKF